MFLYVISTIMSQSHDFTHSISPRLSYTCNELRIIGETKTLGSLSGLLCTTLPKEIRRRKRGRPGGLRRRLRSRKCKPYLPSVIMGNVRSIRNKSDELAANVRYRNEFRNISILSMTETWLTSDNPDDHIVIDGFKLIRGDRILENTGKHCGG